MYNLVELKGVISHLTSGSKRGHIPGPGAEVRPGDLVTPDLTAQHGVLQR